MHDRAIRPAPGDLARVQALVNTLDLETGEDELSSAWLVEHGFAPTADSAPVRRAARGAARRCCSRTTAPRMRRRLDLARVGHGRPFDADGAPRLSGDDAVGQVLAIVAIAAADGHLGAAEGVSRGRLPLGVLRLLPQPLAHVVHDEHVRQPRQGADLPRASAEGVGVAEAAADVRRVGRQRERHPGLGRRVVLGRDAERRLGRLEAEARVVAPGGRAARSAGSPSRGRARIASSISAAPMPSRCRAGSTPIGPRPSASCSSTWRLAEHDVADDRVVVGGHEARARGRRRRAAGRRSRPRACSARTPRAAARAMAARRRAARGGCFTARRWRRRPRARPARPRGRRT